MENLQAGSRSILEFDRVVFYLPHYLIFMSMTFRVSWCGCSHSTKQSNLLYADAALVAEKAGWKSWSSSVTGCAARVVCQMVNVDKTAIICCISLHPIHPLRMTLLTWTSISILEYSLQSMCLLFGFEHADIIWELESFTPKQLLLETWDGSQYIVSLCWML